MKSLKLAIAVVFGLAFYFNVPQAAAEPNKADPAPVVDDPTVFTPPAELPTFTPVLSDEELKTHVEALRGQTVRSSPDAPWCGQLIREVEPDSQASQLGIHVGDVIISIDGKAIRVTADLHRNRDEDADSQLMRIWDCDAKTRRDVKVGPGKLGVRYTPLLRAEQMYVQSLQPGQTPDDDIMLACAAVQSAYTDSACAQTLLSRILSRGKPAPVVYYLAAQTAWAVSRLDDALAFALAAEKALPADQRWMLFWAKRDSAIASFHLAVAAEADAEYGELALPDAPTPQYQAVEDALADFRKMPLERMSNPVEEFAKLNSTDRTGELKYDSDAPIYRVLEQQLHKTRMLNAKDDGSDPNISCQSMFTQTTGSNVDFYAIANFKAVNDQPTEKARAVRFIIMQGNNEALICFYIYPNGSGRFSGIKDLPETRCLVPEALENKKFKVRLTVVGNRMEVLVNSRRVYYGLVRAPEKTRQLSLQIESNGVEEHLTNIAWRTAGPRSGA